MSETQRDESGASDFEEYAAKMIDDCAKHGDPKALRIQAERDERVGALAPKDEAESKRLHALYRPLVLRVPGCDCSYCTSLREAAHGR